MTSALGLRELRHLEEVILPFQISSGQLISCIKQREACIRAKCSLTTGAPQTWGLFLSTNFFLTNAVVLHSHVFYSFCLRLLQKLIPLVILHIFNCGGTFLSLAPCGWAFPQFLVFSSY